MCELIKFLTSIPDVIWSGVIASILTLSGVLISNRSNTHRLRIQLEHDAKEKQKERIATLRRDTYLKAVEELTKANSHIASLSQKDPTKENLADGLQGFFGEAAKLQLVAEPKTALLVNKLVAEYSELLLRLLVDSAQLHEFRSQIEIHDNLYESAHVEVNRVLAEMVRFNESANNNQFVFSALQHSFENFQRQSSEHLEARTNAWAEFNSLSISFSKKVFLEMRLLGEKQIPVLIEIRRDLGLISDLDEFRENMEAQWLRISAQFDTLLEKLQTG